MDNTKSGLKLEPRWLIALGLAALLAGLAGFALGVLSQQRSMLELMAKLLPSRLAGSPSNILVVGTDAADDVHRSDTIIVASFDPGRNKIGLLSIPRDLRVPIPGYGSDKINHAYSYGGGRLLKQALADFLRVPIGYYIEVDFVGLENLIDGLGGIVIPVDKKMHYVDLAGDTNIDLKPGLHRLKGKEALNFVRFRQDPKGDLGRIERQQKFLKALANESLKFKNVSRLPQLIRRFQDNVETNLSTAEMLQLALKIKEAYQQDRLVTATAKGEPVMIDGVFYLVPDGPAIKRSVKEVLAVPFWNSL